MRFQDETMSIEALVTQRIGETVNAAFDAIGQGDTPAERALLHALQTIEALHEHTERLQRDKRELLDELHALTNARR